jgi:hypothetical protein
VAKGRTSLGQADTVFPQERDIDLPAVAGAGGQINIGSIVMPLANNKNITPNTMKLREKESTALTIVGRAPRLIVPQFLPM